MLSLSGSILEATGRGLVFLQNSKRGFQNSPLFDRDMFLYDNHWKF